MRDSIGFIGDIHGEAELLETLLQRIEDSVEQLIFLGDYVNRGRRSQDVLELLWQYSKENRVKATFLAGNHDTAFLRAVRNGRIDPFLRMGGAATIRSYIREPVTDLPRQLAKAVPPSHIKFLESLQRCAVGRDYIASHDPSTYISKSLRGDRFGIFGHIPQTGLMPQLGEREALIDTGCGTLPDGRLTCLFWPSRTWVQVRPK